MEYTGERMMPEKADARTFWEHIYRYRFAAGYVHNKEVLDIACGEGYGVKALEKSGAAKVVGIDISPESCEHAKMKYGVDARVGSAEAIPVENSCMDVVVSFETIEHVPRPDIFLDECRRVLRPGGVLIISTPNREPYRKLSPNNPFHCSELSHLEFAGMCEKRFTKIEYFSQRPFWTAKWSVRGLAMPEDASSGKRAELGWFLQKWLCPNLSENETLFYQEHPVEAILASPRLFSSMVDPYSIRKYKPQRIEIPVFTLAVAYRAYSG